MTPLSYCWRDSLRLRMGLHWKKATPSPSDCPGLIRSALVLAALVCFAFIFAFTAALIKVKQAQSKCPIGTVVESINIDGSVDCVMAVNRDPAKVIRKGRVQA